MDDSSQDIFSGNVGERLRSLRGERGISMRSLARKSNLSANALSMIERGLTSPSVSTLSKLANALEVPICAFFRQQPDRHKVVFSKVSERNRIAFPRGVWEGLSGEKFAGRVEGFLLNLEKGATSGPHGILHTGQEFVYCLSGSIEYEVESERYVMNPGDSLIFSARMNHHWRNVGDSAAQAVVLISGFDDGERPGTYHLASARASERRSEMTEIDEQDEGFEKQPSGSRSRSRRNAPQSE